MDFNGTASGFFNGLPSSVFGNFFVYGRGLFADGSAAFPSISFINSPTTGLFRPAADVLAFTTAGTEDGRITASGNWLFGTAIDSGNGRLQLATHTTSAGGIGFGTDVSMFRSGAGQIRIGGTVVTLGIDLSASNVTLSNVSAGGSSLIIYSNGSVLVTQSNAAATNATDGFLYVRSCPGTPTGAPTTIGSAVPLIVDSVNNKLYFYSGGAWRDAGP